MDRSEHSCSRRHGGARNPTAVGGACSRRCTRSVPRTTGGWAASPSWQRSEDGSNDLGGSVAATLPLFAQFLDEPMVEPSPYSPASRLFWNETYIDVTRVPGLDGCAEAREALDDPSFREQVTRLQKTELSDHPAVAAAKRRVLDPLAQHVFRGTLPAGLAEFAANPRAADYARFRAEAERRGAWWGAWPDAERDGSLSGAAVDDDRARYHLFAQWVAAEQLSEAAGRASARRADARSPDRSERRRLRRLART